jgi:hypothetical protein
MYQGEMNLSYGASNGLTMTVSPYDRRRSQRLFLQVRIVVEGRVAGDASFSEKTHTIVVNAHGALVEMSIAPDQGRTLILKNVLTNGVQESKVVLVTASDSGKINVALEFTAPNPGFWSISFPPEDWSIHNTDAK